MLGFKDRYSLQAGTGFHDCSGYPAMKRLTVRYKKWLCNRARTESKRRGSWRTERKKRAQVKLVDAWTGTDMIQVKVKFGAVEPPKVICFDANPAETLQFLADCRRRSMVENTYIPAERFSWLESPKRKGGLPTINRFVDYSGIEQISTAAALVLTADYDRLATILGSAPPTINLHKWSPAVFTRLFDLGFFEVVGLNPDITSLYSDDGRVKTMRILKGTSTEGLEAASLALVDLSRELTAGKGIEEPLEVAINSALSEAMSNVARHAYPADHAFPYRHVGRWWVTAEIDRVARTLSVAIFDQGASIPVTLPKKALLHRMSDLLSASLSREGEGRFAHDSSYIFNAMRTGSTQTEKSFHGYGLPQMVSLIDECGNGRITIMSRGGRCDRESGGSVKRTNYECSIGGTLIVWRLELRERLHHGQ